MSTLPKQYDPKISEAHWQKQWETQGTYAFCDDMPKEQTFVIDTPPPTVSGVLHMGHIFSYTQADFVARYKRMQGFDVFYPMGFDDNGLPTERLVEKIKGVRGSSMPREEFVALCRDVVKDAEEEFKTLFTSVALSVDWKQLYQTVSDRVIALSQASFLDLISKGESYRDFRPTYWDWVDQTAIATAEVENKDMQGVMVELKFALEKGGDITIATTRPELLGACVAVMYHPEDANAAKYKDNQAITPLFGVKVPMIADEAVDKEFGTGLVMCCTFGDDTDKDWVRKYKLPIISAITRDGRISTADIFPSIPLKGEAPEERLAELEADWRFQFSGLKIKPARIKIMELLEAEGVLLSKKDIMHTVKCAERSGTPIEIIPTYQWFVRLTDKKEALKSKGAEVAWHPEFMRIRLNQWIDGLKEDWCISRQRFFGVPFPVWYKYKPEGGFIDFIFPSPEELPLDPTSRPPKEYEYIEESGIMAQGQFFYKARHKETGEMCQISPSYDVMDTWATSSISPQINAKSLSPNKLFPADLRPQAHEIIRTWAFYTIAKAHLHANTIPWKHVMISGWCLASDKQKMSKSKGNVVTPVALIEDKGADAVRYWASTSRLAADTAFSEDLLKIGKKLVGKIWNASNLIAQLPKASKPATQATEMLDKWILSRLSVAVTKATKAFEEFEYCDARVAIEDFFWNDFCDNYLELVKARAYNEGAGQASALFALETCLETILRLFAPFVPHVTEEIYSHLFANKGSIHQRGNWPKATDYAQDEQAERAGSAAVEILEIIRKAKSEANVSIKAPVARIKIYATEKATVPFTGLAFIMDDLKAAGSVHEVMKSPSEELTYTTRDGAYRVDVELAKVEDIRRNSDHGEHEKLEGKVLSAPGKPDLSKHTVKAQVAGLATSLERQK